MMFTFSECSWNALVSHSSSSVPSIDSDWASCSTAALLAAIGSQVSECKATSRILSPSTVVISNEESLFWNGSVVLGMRSEKDISSKGSAFRESCVGGEKSNGASMISTESGLGYL